MAAAVQSRFSGRREPPARTKDPSPVLRQAQDHLSPKGRGTQVLRALRFNQRRQLLQLGLRISHDSEDDLISGLIRAAREEVERATNAALIDQTWRLTLDDWPETASVAVHRWPLKQVLAVTVYDADGAGAELEPGDWLADGEANPPRIHFERKPPPGQAINGVEIDFVAGFGSAGPDVPDALRRAIQMLVAHWFEFRSHVGPDNQPVGYPQGYDRLIASWKPRRLI